MGTTDKVRLSYFLNSGYKLDEVVFADGTVWNQSTLMAKLLEGTEGSDNISGFSTADVISAGGGNDVVYAGYGNDVIDGGTGDDTIYADGGNDTLDGGAGNDFLSGGYDSDTYLFGRGSGQDTIDNYDPNSGKVDRLVLGADITPEQIQVSRVSNHVDLSIVGTTDKVRLSYFLNSGYKLDEVVFADGTVWNQSTLMAKLLEGTEGSDNISGFSTADVISAGGGNDVVYAGYGNDVIDGGTGDDTIYADGGNDTLDGGAGNDFLSGGYDSDTYLFGRGSGQDTIDNYDPNSGKVDRLVLGADITPEQIQVTRASNHVDLSIVGTTDKVRLSYFLNSGYALDEVVFADGTVWNEAAVKAKLLEGSDANDYITGFSTADVISAGGGNDTVYAGYGDDDIDGGSGNDSIYADGGNDTLDGGAGDDFLSGGYDSDTYLFGRGSGQDTIDNYDPGAGVDRLSFGTNIAADQLWFRQSGSGLEVSVIGTDDAATINYWYSNTNYRLDEFVTSSGETLLASQVDALVNAMAAFAPPASGQTTLPQNYQDALGLVIAASWTPAG